MILIGLVAKWHPHNVVSSQIVLRKLTLKVLKVRVFSVEWTYTKCALFVVSFKLLNLGGVTTYMYRASLYRINLAF